MTKKRLLLIASLPLAVAVALGVLAMLPPQPGVTKSNFERIEKGMTNTKVKEILGGESIMIGGAGNLRHFSTLELWPSVDGASAEIWFDDDIVVSKQWKDSTETILQRIRRVLHLN